MADAGPRSEAMHASLPNKVKCCKCKKNKPLQHFSQNQLRKLYVWNARLGSSNEAPKVLCSPCVDALHDQTQEMYCQGCESWKPKDKFANSMRKRPDDAMCKICTAVIEQVDPITREDEEEDLPEVNGEFASSSRGSSRARGMIGASDAYDGEDESDEEPLSTTPGASIRSSFVGLSLCGANRGVVLPGRSEEVSSESFTATNSEVDTESVADSISVTSELPPLQGFVRASQRHDTGKDENSDEDVILIGSKSRVPPRMQSFASTNSDIASSTARDRTAPAMDENVPWQSAPLSKARVAPRSRLTSASVAGVSVDPDGLPTNLNRMAYGNPAAPPPSDNSVRFTKEASMISSVKRGGNSNFARPAPRARPVASQMIRADIKPLPTAVPPPPDSEDEDSDFC